MGARNKARTQMKLGLGTAQWGKPYGISNTLGVPSFVTIKNILKIAKDNGINTIHLKRDYGVSSKIVDYILEQGFKIYPSFATTGVSYESFYEWKEISQTLSRSKRDIIQVPLNVFDQRLLKWLPTIKNKNVDIHARSIFLQGLLLMYDDKFKTYFDFIESQKLTRIEAAIQFIRQIEQVDVALVGVVTTKQLKEIIQAWKKPLLDINFSKFAVNDVNVIDPRRWKTTG